MRASFSVPLLALFLVTACGGPAVEVRTAPTTPTAAGEQAVQVTNNLSQAVNVYVTATGSGELFLRQVPANTVERVTVQGVANNRGRGRVDDPQFNNVGDEIAEKQCG